MQIFIRFYQGAKNTAIVGYKCILFFMWKKHLTCSMKSYIDMIKHNVNFNNAGGDTIRAVVKIERRKEGRKKIVMFMYVMKVK